VRPISYVRANAAELLLDLAETRVPILITQNGVPTAVLQDIAGFEAAQEQTALLQILLLGLGEIDRGELAAFPSQPLLVTRGAQADLDALEDSQPAGSRESILASLADPEVASLEAAIPDALAALGLRQVHEIRVDRWRLLLWRAGTVPTLVLACDAEQTLQLPLSRRLKPR
jgi:prevent-host-death family protein